MSEPSQRAAMKTRSANLLRAIALCALLSVFYANGASAEAAPSSDVLVLDVKNFTETVQKYDFLVVEFYAPWCGHCRNLAPPYEKAATTLKSHNPPIILAKVDVNEEENKPLGSQYDIQGFPTLKVFRKKGEVVQEYKGPREADGIISYLKKLSGPPSVELTSVDQAEEFLSENEGELAVIGVFENLDGEEYTNFIKAADSLRGDYLFAHTVDVSYVPDSGKPLKSPSIRMHKNFDDKIADSTDFSVDALKKFLEVESVPLITVMNMKPENRPALVKFFDSAKDKLFLFFAAPEGGEDGAQEKKSASYLKDAKRFKEKNLIFLSCEAADSANALQYFGLSAEDLPAHVIQSEKGLKYVERNVNYEELARWIEDYLAGKLKDHVKSEPIPETNDEPVKVIVADSIKESVLEAKKDVLLEFYAPWCGHCKSLAPILDEVAISFKSDPDIMIAKYDATANDVPSDLFDVKGFPTMYFCTAKGQILPFDASRTKEGITEFINKNRSTAVNSSKDDQTFTDKLKEAIPDSLISGVKDEL